MPAPSARDRKVLSTPKKTSPCGLPLVRIAWLTAAPASPALRIRTFRPDDASNFFSTPSEIANDSCVTSVTVLGPPPDSSSLQALRPVSVTAAARPRRSRREVMAGPPVVGARGRGTAGDQLIALARRPSAGITQCRFYGSAAPDGRPLSPADPSSPTGL